MSEITTLAIDLAKHVFQLHGVDQRGVCTLRRQVRRARLLPLLAQLPACTVAMEACAGAHEWGRRIEALGHRVRLIAPRGDERCRALMQRRGVGPLTASAFAAEIGDPQVFKNGRQVSAALGLVPRQHSSGGKPLLLGISKRGNPYLRTLLIHGARAVLRTAKHHHDPLSQWLCALQARRGTHKATVALANKMARQLWAQLAYG